MIKFGYHQCMQVKETEARIIIICFPNFFHVPQKMQHLKKIWDNLDKISHNFRNSVKLMIQVTLSTKLHTNAVHRANKTW